MKNISSPTNVQRGGSHGSADLSAKIGEFNGPCVRFAGSFLTYRYAGRTRLTRLKIGWYVLHLPDLNGFYVLLRGLSAVWQVATT